MSDTAAIVDSIAKALPVIMTVLLTWWRLRRKVREVHTLVNSAHTQALEEIKALRELLAVCVRDAKGL